MEQTSTHQEPGSSITVIVEFLYVIKLLRAESARLLATLTCSSGGLDILFSKRKKHEITIPAKDESGMAVNIAFLIKYLCDNLMTDTRKDLFVQGDTM